MDDASAGATLPVMIYAARYGSLTPLFRAVENPREGGEQPRRNVKLVLRPLVTAWEQIMFMPAEWQGIYESAQRSLRQ